MRDPFRSAPCRAQVPAQPLLSTQNSALPDFHKGGRSHAAVARPTRPDFIRYLPLPCAVCERKQQNPRSNGIDADQPDERQRARAREEEYEYAECDGDDAIENQQCLAM